MTGRTRPPKAFDSARDSHPNAFDPFRLCVYTTVAILAWLLTPAAVVAAFSGVALVAYFRARRQGLARSRCKLGDTRLVMAYLGVAFAAGMAFTALRIVSLF